jgi:hypothetical protein
LGDHPGWDSGMLVGRKGLLRSPETWMPRTTSHQGVRHLFLEALGDLALHGWCRFWPCEPGWYADMLIEKWQANVCFSSVCQPFFGRKTWRILWRHRGSTAPSHGRRRENTSRHSTWALDDFMDLGTCQPKMNKPRLFVALVDNLVVL